MECEECGDTCKRRIKCSNCGKLVCSWCYHHTHKLETLPAPDLKEYGELLQTFITISDREAK